MAEALEPLKVCAAVYIVDMRIGASVSYDLEFKHIARRPADQLLCFFVRTRAEHGDAEAFLLVGKRQSHESLAAGVWVRVPKASAAREDGGAGLPQEVCRHASTRHSRS
eukprot:1486602-Pleurochrysis_carterae.AAC.1